MLRRSLGFSFIVLAASCSGSSTDIAVSSAVGTWSLTRVNGLSMPASVPGATVSAGRLEIIGGVNNETSGGGAIEWCANQVAIFYDLRWSSIDDSRVQISYPSFSGAAHPIDTATVAGDQLTLNSHLVITDRIGGLSRETWTMARVTDGGGTGHC